MVILWLLEVALTYFSLLGQLCNSGVNRQNVGLQNVRAVLCWFHLWHLTWSEE
jgi:hypothetical protein